VDRGESAGKLVDPETDVRRAREGRTGQARHHEAGQPDERAFHVQEDRMWNG